MVLEYSNSVDFCILTFILWPCKFSLLVLVVCFLGVYFFTICHINNHILRREIILIFLSYWSVCPICLFTYLFSFIALKRSPVYCWVELVRLRILSLFSVREESFQYFTKYNINTVSHHLLRSSLCSRQTLTWHPKILTSFYSYPCVICFSWVWAGHIDLLLMNRAQQKWWNITLKFRS